MHKMLEALKEERNGIAATLQATFDKAADEGRDINEVEERNVSGLDKRLAEIDARIAQLTDLATRNAKADEALAKVETQTRNIRVTSEPLTYAKENRSTSYFADLYAATSKRDPEATERLVRHRREMEVETRATATTDLSTGFVPPAYLSADYADLRVAGRPVANAIGSRELTSNLMTIPRWTAGTTIAAQATQNTDLGSATLTSSDISAAAETLGGYVDVSQQVLDFNKSISDGEIYADLVRNYNKKVEDFVLQNNASQKYGIVNTPSIQTVHYSEAAAWETFFAKVIEAKKKIRVAYYGEPDVMIVSPQVYSWLEGRVDSDKRPVFSPIGAMNNPGILNPNVTQGAVGFVAGLPVIVSHSVPADYTGSATPSDSPVIVANLSEMRLWEGSPRTDVFTDVLSATAGVRFRLFSYVAFTNQRFPSATCLIYGNGLSGL